MLKVRPRRRGAPSVLRRRFRKSENRDGDRRDCLPIRNLHAIQGSAMCSFFCKLAVSTSYDRANMWCPSAPRPPFVARAPHDRERASLARLPDARRASTVPGRARPSRDRPPERSHPTRLRTRRGSEKARPWRRPPCRRSWCVSTPRTRPRLSCSPPTGLEGPRAPAPRRPTSAGPRRRRVPNASRTLVVSRHVVARGERSIVFS